MPKSKQQRGYRFPVHERNMKFGPDPNKSDNDIISESPFKFLSEIKKIEGKRPPRPSNAFFLYRSYYMDSAEFKNRTGENKRAASVSKELAERWKKETDAVKKVFFARARIVDKMHAELYIDYKYIKNSKNSKNQQKIPPNPQIHDNNSISEETSSQYSTTGLMNIQDNNNYFEFDNIFKLSDQQYLIYDPSTGLYCLYTFGNTIEPEWEYPQQTSELADSPQTTYNTCQTDILQQTYENLTFDGIPQQFELYEHYNKST
ncbi:hypothetical protein C1645_748427 [Glomus cerebriforme]|uniref:HMG box domain-containing protein n=1 Tax=Glomus cerebriforme TaxID=658196 RepID=A0A397TKZ9_9GLOM|nr:hypothetical protein C1645_748427 [Glomus cerebriforme]